MWNVFVSGENFLAKISKEFKETINWADGGVFLRFLETPGLVL